MQGQQNKRINKNHFLDEHLNMHKNILEYLKSLDQNYCDRKKNAQKKYMKSFLVILDRIKKELQSVQKTYNPVDIQIRKEQACQKIKQDLGKHKQRCYQLQSETKQAKVVLEQQKRKNLILKAQKNALISALKRKDRQKQQLQVRAGHLEHSSLLANSSDQQKIKGQSLGNIFFFQKFDSIRQKNSQQMKVILSKIQLRKRSSQRVGQTTCNKTVSQRKPQTVNPQNSLYMTQRFNQANNKLSLRIRKPYMKFMKP